jgi:hypothetical protein
VRLNSGGAKSFEVFVLSVAGNVATSRTSLLNDAIKGKQEALKVFWNMFLLISRRSKFVWQICVKTKEEKNSTIFKYECKFGLFG